MPRSMELSLSKAQLYVYAGWQRRLAWERGIGWAVQDRAEQDRIGGAR